jgi:hypothetical protein
MTKTFNHRGIIFIDFLKFVETKCCKKYLTSLDTYELKNDIANKDVQSLFYHSLIESVITYFMKENTLDKKIFYVDKLKLQGCCLVGDNDVKQFLKFFIKFIKDLKTKLNILFVCDNYSFEAYVECIETDVYLCEQLNNVLKTRQVSSEKVYNFLDKTGLKKLSKIYKEDMKVKFWLK